MKDDRHKKFYIRCKLKLLKEFHVPVDDTVERRLNELYPNEIDVENYTHMLIRDYLYSLGD